jgi:hypothetical protein
MVGLVNAELSLVSQEKILKARPKSRKARTMEDFFRYMV